MIEFFLIAVVLAYLLGSAPFGLILCFMAGYGDIRKIGSGNIGATNVLRTGNKLLALLTLLLDSGKGAIAVTLAYFLVGFEAAMMAGLFAILGHMYPVWLKFKGGKGVATVLGTLLAISPMIGIAVCLTWLASAVLFRVSSLSALIALASSPFWVLWISGNIMLMKLCLILALLVFSRHRDNIARLWSGEEAIIGQKKKG